MRTLTVLLCLTAMAILAGIRSARLVKYGDAGVIGE
jgi:hypothetical protein